LRVEVYQKGFLPPGRKRRAEIKRGCALAASAFDAGNGEYFHKLCRNVRLMKAKDEELCKGKFELQLNYN